MKEFKDWEKDFIYLTYPYYQNKFLANYLGASSHTIANIGIQQFKLNKYYNNIKVGDIFEDVKILVLGKKYENKNAALCECKCGKTRHITINDLFMFNTTKCNCVKKTKFDIKLAINMYNKFYSLKKIADYFKVSKTKILFWFKKEKVKIRNKNYYFKLGKSPNHTGYKDISGTNWGKIRRGALQRNLEFSISMEYAQSILEKQDFKCALTGENLYTDKPNQRNSGNLFLDRIDSKLGYIENNIQWVSKQVNISKMDLTQQEFIELCQKVVNHQNLLKTYNLVGQGNKK